MHEGAHKKEIPMSSTALATARQQTQAVRHRNPLLSVLIWELRRFRSSRPFWIQALAFFGFTLFVTWLGRAPGSFQYESPTLSLSASVAGTSAWGFLHVYLGYVLLLGVLLPFVNAEGVTRDLSRRTHELLMTTPLPNWAYVWGRYLMGLLVSVGLAILLLAGIVGMGTLLHLTTPDYPKPELDNLLILWGSMVLPATVLVSSVSFALGTLLPRQANLAKILVVTAWCFGVVILLSTDPQNGLPTWYSTWDPTSGATARSMAQHYQTFFTGLPNATSETQFQNTIQGIENMPPNISNWLVQHLLLTGLSLLLVVLAALTFRRFRSTFGA
jgi:ABC-type transport system involved in multi-copper enzyme maturation permease subunit